MPFATWRAEPSGVISAMNPGRIRPFMQGRAARSPASALDVFQECHEVEVGAIDVDVAATVHDDLVEGRLAGRSGRRGRPATRRALGARGAPPVRVRRTINWRPSGSHSMECGLVPGSRVTTSLLPSRSTRDDLARAPMAEPRLPSCQRADSPITRPGPSGSSVQA